MKTVLKILGSAVLVVLCLAVLAFSGYFLLSAIPRDREEPQVLSTDQFFRAEEAEAEAPPPAEEVPATEETLEAAEEVPPAEEEPEQAPEPETEEAAPSDVAQLAQTYLQAMTLEEKLWQLIVTTPEDLTGKSPVTLAGEQTRASLEARPVGGLCYFSANLVDRDQTAEMLTLTQSYAKTPLFLAVDEEGGNVSRVGANEAMGVTWFDPAASYGESGDVAQVYNAGKTIAQELGELGFNLDFAPVADIVTNPNNTEIGDRAYSDDPAVAAPMVSAMVEGLQRGGMLSCLKHFPGHGSTEADSHEGLSVSTRTLEELRSTEWQTFRAGIESGAAFVMVGHQTNRNLSDLPASLSPEVMGYLRDELGFEGIIITDSLKMGAIVNDYTSAQAAVLAIQAGADMILMPNDLDTAYHGLLSAVTDGALTEDRINESVLRILTAKYRFGIME